MSRRLRYIPDGGALVEVTSRTIHSRFLLRPGREVDEIIVGVLGRAQRLYGVRICGYMFASSHFHLLLDVDTGRQMASFMCHVNSNLAREIARLHGWKEKIWGRRYQAIVVSGEEEAQVARLRYLLAKLAAGNCGHLSPSALSMTRWAALFSIPTNRFKRPYIFSFAPSDASAQPSAP